MARQYRQATQRGPARRRAVPPPRPQPPGGRVHLGGPESLHQTLCIYEGFHSGAEPGNPGVFLHRYQYRRPERHRKVVPERTTTRVMYSTIAVMKAVWALLLCVLSCSAMNPLESRLERQMHLWQKRLGLDEWNLSVRLVRQSEIDRNSWGSAEWRSEERRVGKEC